MQTTAAGLYQGYSCIAQGFMAHKKKGGSKKPSAPSGPQANGTSSPREDAPVPASFKDAILKDAVVDGSGKIALHASSTYHLTTSVLLSQQCLVGCSG